MDLFDYVGQRIRALRKDYASGRGISQEALAKALDVAPNTISRWETATYRPTLQDMERLARFFSVPILEFFPPEEAAKAADDRLNALLRAAKQLPPEDVEELQRYAEFRRARNLYVHRARANARRTGKQAK